MILEDGKCVGMTRVGNRCFSFQNMRYNWLSAQVILTIQYKKNFFTFVLLSISASVYVPLFSGSVSREVQLWAHSEARKSTMPWNLPFENHIRKSIVSGLGPLSDLWWVTLQIDRQLLVLLYIDPSTVENWQLHDWKSELACVCAPHCHRGTELQHVKIFFFCHISRLWTQFQ